jgi:hypothetical protein
LLGGLLVLFSPGMAEALGVPAAQPSSFYPSILGGVLIGIGIALLMEARRAGVGPVGLGLGGAAAINVCGGLILGGWLLCGRLMIPLRGRFLLWVLVAALLAISAVELSAVFKEGFRVGGARALRTREPRE